jgi:hypothetical protein
MATQSVLFVVLPNGLDAKGAPRASLYLTPRLGEAHTLADFPDFLDWTDLVQSKGLTFELAQGAAKATVTAPRTGLRPDLWREIFTPQTYVAPYPKPNFDQRLVVSYPVATAYGFLQWAYQKAATLTGVEDNDDNPFYSLLSELVFRRGERSTLDQTLSELRVALWNAQNPPPPPPPIKALTAAASLPAEPIDTRAMIERFALFHHLPPAPGARPLPKTPADFAKTLDFHKALSALSAYPALMRALGLVIDVTLPRNFVAPSPGSSTTSYRTLSVSKVTPGWSWHVKTSLSRPSTSYVKDAQQFDAAPATGPAAAAKGNFEPSDIVEGYLALAPHLFGLIDVDLDGALLKAMGLADNIAAVSDISLVEPILPSLRSGGVSLIANGRAQEVLRSIRDNTAFMNAEASGVFPRALTARDVTRGYRLDIWSTLDGTWRSLHRRNGTYAFGSDGGLVVHVEDEEGFTQLGVAQPTADPTRKEDKIAKAAGIPQPGTDLYVHERIARWNGWSLSAPRPATPINRSANPAMAANPDPTADEPITPFKMKASFSAFPGSLPRLRFGARYRLRVRAVDLGGNSRALQAAAPSRFVAPRGDPLSYFRFEPLSPPVFLLRTRPERGGSLLRMVIRSYNSRLELDSARTEEVDQRHLAPPKVDVLTVERHGRFDDAQGHVRGDKATYELIIARDSGAFPAVGHTPIEPAAQAVTPYFPDPIARGVAFANLPNTPDDTTGLIEAGQLHYETLTDVEPRPGSITMIAFSAPWPNSQPLRLQLAGSAAAPVWNNKERVLTVFLPKAAVTQIPVSCYPAPEDLPLLGVWDWMRAWFEAQENVAMGETDAGAEVVETTNARGLLTRLVLEGGHPMISPPHLLTLVHAVQQPLGVPEWLMLPVVHDPAAPLIASALRNGFSPITAWRSLASHHAVLLGGLRISGASSSRVDLEARWTEYIDDLDEPGPTTVAASDHVETIELKTLEGGMIPADGLATRYVASYIPQIDALWFAATFDQLQGVAPPFELAAPLHHFDDTKHRRVRYTAIATSRFVEYFPQDGLEFTRTSDALGVDVPSSARPVAPDTLYVVPTFGWERQEATNVKTEYREGNGLRVYLNRPWYSSGVGELLGVVLWPQSAPNPPDDAQRDQYKTLFTQWGLDPIWAGGALEAVPSVGDFNLGTADPNLITVGQNLTLEGSSLTVDVAGYPVSYDENRRLWYCDIELAVPSAYAPFIRLALARYQPRSIAGTELSQVVLTDYAQLAPDRSAALSLNPANPKVGRLWVGGLAATGPTRSVITVEVERKDSTMQSDLGWKTAAAAEVRVLTNSPAPSDPESVLWEGSIVFSSVPPPGRFRVVVREFEIYPIDPVPSDIIDPPTYAERLVYASIILWDF